jgi:secreted trypsin-like serine protease
MKARSIFGVCGAAAVAASAMFVAAPASAIVGGTPAPQPYPFLVELTLSGATHGIPGLHRCGASLLTAEWAVTAAHCVAGAPIPELVARVGSNDRTQGGEVRQVSKAIVHPGFQSPQEGVLVNDVAMIKLSAPVAAEPITIAARAPEPGARIRIMGWGKTCTDDVLDSPCTVKPTLLQQLDTIISDRALCEGMDPATELCTGDPAGGSGACQGDSGGPQITSSGYGRWELTGITSRDGRGATTCAQHPGIYVSATAYTPWITQTLREQSQGFSTTGAPRRNPPAERLQPRPARQQLVHRVPDFVRAPAVPPNALWSRA